jgi:hypothetical protein
MFPGRSAARSPCGAVRCRAGAVPSSVFVTVPALRSGMQNAAPRPGHGRYAAALCRASSALYNANSSAKAFAMLGRARVRS